jgi:hypothetical protein
MVVVIGAKPIPKFTSEIDDHTKSGKSLKKCPNRTPQTGCNTY